MQYLQRGHALAHLTIAASSSMSTSADLSRFAGGLVTLPTGWDTNDVAFFVSHDNVTFTQLRDDANADQIISGGEAGYAYPIPADAFAAKWLKVESQTGGASANQAAERVVILQLKG